MFKKKLIKNFVWQCFSEAASTYRFHKKYTLSDTYNSVSEMPPAGNMEKGNNQHADAQLLECPKFCTSQDSLNTHVLSKLYMYF